MKKVVFRIAVILCLVVQMTWSYAAQIEGQIKNNTGGIIYLCLASLKYGNWHGPEGSIPPTHSYSQTSGGALGYIDTTIMFGRNRDCSKNTCLIHLRYNGFHYSITPQNPWLPNLTCTVQYPNKKKCDSCANLIITAK